MESGNGRWGNTWRILSIRNSTRDGKKQNKNKKIDEQFPIPFRLLFEICAPFRERGGEHRRAFFFLLVTYPAGKIGGRRGKGKRGEGCACFAKARVDEPRSWEHGDTKFRSACYFPRHSGKCSREGFPREAINLHPNRGNHYFHRGMAHLQSKQINPLRAMNI